MTETINIEPNWRNLARFMAQVLKEGNFVSEEARVDFSTQYNEVLRYLYENDPEGHRLALQYGNWLADNWK